MLLSFGLGIVGVGATSIDFSGLNQAAIPSFSLTDDSEVLAMTSPGKTLPEFQGISEWLNSSPLTTKELKGSVILV